MKLAFFAVCPSCQKAVPISVDDEDLNRKPKEIDVVISKNAAEHDPTCARKLARMKALGLR